MASTKQQMVTGNADVEARRWLLEVGDKQFITDAGSLGLGILLRAVDHLGVHVGRVAKVSGASAVAKFYEGAEECLTQSRQWQLSRKS